MEEKQYNDVLETLNELHQNRTVFTCEQIGVLSVLILNAKNLENLTDDSSYVVDELVDMGAIKLSSEGVIMEIDITPSIKDDPEDFSIEHYGWNYVEVDNVGYYMKIVDGVKYNIFKDNLNNYVLINTKTSKRVSFEDPNDMRKYILEPHQSTSTSSLSG